MNTIDCFRSVTGHCRATAPDHCLEEDERSEGPIHEGYRFEGRDPIDPDELRRCLGVWRNLRTRGIQ